MTSTLQNVLDDIEELVEELTPEGRSEPRYRHLEGQVDQPGVSLHRRFWFHFDETLVTSDRGQELSEVVHSFELRMHFDFQRYEKRSFERAIINEATTVWRTIESQDLWGEGVRQVQVAGRIRREDQPNNDSVIAIPLEAMCDEAGGSLTITETPSGTADGSNDDFVLTQTPRISTLLVVKNGLVMRLGTDFTLSGTALTFVSDQIPQTGDIIWVRYQSS